METLADLREKLKEEISYESERRAKAEEKKEMASLKSQIRSKRFARTSPIANKVVNGFVRPGVNSVFKGLVKAGSTAGKGIQKAAAETQRREAAKKKAGAKARKPGVFNAYGERIG